MIPASVSGLSVTALARWAASLPLPEMAAPATRRAPAPDVVVFSSAPLRLLSDLAATGLRQLLHLLPALERAVEDDVALSLGHVAQAVGVAARQLGDGHAALLGEGPDRVATALPPTAKAALLTAAEAALPTIARQLGGRADSPGSAADRWIATAGGALEEASTLLGHAEDRLRPMVAASLDTAPTLPGVTPNALWAMTAVNAAQAQVTAAAGSLLQWRHPSSRLAASASGAGFGLDRLAGATTVFGAALFLALLWLVGGAWAVATGLGATAASLAVAALWLWRVVVSARGARLDLRRRSGHDPGGTTENQPR